MDDNKMSKLRMNIQLFADEADNAADGEGIQIPDAGVDNAIDDDDVKVNFTDGAQGNDNDDTRATTKAFSARLKREREKIEKEYADKKQKELDAIAVSRGFKNWDDLSSYNDRDTLEQLGIKDADRFNSYVDNLVSRNPSVIEAQKIIESNKEKEQEEIIKNAISEINSFDSDIKSVDDLLKIPNYDDFYGLVSKGYSLTDAYKIVAFDKITSAKAASAAQTVKNNINSKGHMKSMTGTQTHDVVIPDEVLATYHKNMPGMTDKEIREHYSKFIGGK